MCVPVRVHAVAVVLAHAAAVARVAVAVAASVVHADHVEAAGNSG